MSKMIERVARALEPRAWAVLGTPSDSVAYRRRRTWSTRQARFAIEALRDLTPEMQACGRDAIEPYVGRGLSKPVKDQWQIGREVWSAMLDAALADPGEGMKP